MQALEGSGTSRNASQHSRSPRGCWHDLLALCSVVLTEARLSKDPHWRKPKWSFWVAVMPVLIRKISKMIWHAVRQQAALRDHSFMLASVSLGSGQRGAHTLKKSRWLYTPPALFLTALLMFMGTALVPTAGIICSTVSTCINTQPSAHAQQVLGY